MRKSISLLTIALLLLNAQHISTETYKEKALRNQFRKGTYPQATEERVQHFYNEFKTMPTTPGLLEPYPPYPWDFSKKARFRRNLSRSEKRRYNAIEAEINEIYKQFPEYNQLWSEYRTYYPYDNLYKEAMSAITAWIQSKPRGVHIYKQFIAFHDAADADIKKDPKVIKAIEIHDKLVDLESEAIAAQQIKAELDKKLSIVPTWLYEKLWK